MKIGLYFGSFNPVHNGHLIIAQHIINETDLNQVWMVVSPQNPFKIEHKLLNEYHRLHLLHIALENSLSIKATDVEFRLPKPSYTIDTLTYLKEKYPHYEFAIIMGSDSLQNLSKWKNASLIMNNYPVFVYKRPRFEITDHQIKNLTVLEEAPLLEISSTRIRELLQKKKSARFLLPDTVLKEIEENNYYVSK